MVTMDTTRYPWILYGLEYSEYSSFHMYSEREYSFASLSIRFSPRVRVPVSNDWAVVMQKHNVTYHSEGNPQWPPAVEEQLGHELTVPGYAQCENMCTRHPHACVQTHTHTQARTHGHTHIHTHIHTRTHTYTHTHMYTMGGGSHWESPSKIPQSSIH